jgi:hypothetical protein
MYRTIQLALKARIDTILRAQYSPSFTTDPSGLSITLDTSQTSTSTTVYALYSVASTQTPNYGLIDLNTDGGTSNDVDFQLGYPDASNITVSPSTWQAGQTTPILISGNNLGTAPTAYVDSPGNDITYSYTGMVNGSISANVTVPSGTTDTSATVYVDPGYTGCTGSCFTSNDPSDSTGQAGSAPVGITPAPPPAPTISFNGTAEANNATVNVVAGQQIALSGTIPAAESSAYASQSWSDPGSAAVGCVNWTNGDPCNSSSGSGVSPSIASGMNVAPILSGTNSSSSGSDFILYWIAPGSYSITYYYTLQNGQQSQQATLNFNVSGPVNGTLSVSGPLQPAIFNRATPPMVSVGNGVAVPGITFTASSTSGDGDGQYSFVQIVRTNQINRYDHIQGSCNDQVGVGLDTQYPYGNATPTSTNDSPATQFNATDEIILSNVAFTMYLMWQPSLALSIPIPIGHIDWQWYANVIWVPGSSPASWIWNTGSSVQTPNPKSSAGDFVPDTTYATWTTHASTGPHDCLHE